MELGAQGMGRDMVYSEAGGTPREKDNLVTEKVPDEGNKKQKEWEKKNLTTGEVSAQGKKSSMPLV